MHTYVLEYILLLVPFRTRASPLHYHWTNWQMHTLVGTACISLSLSLSCALRVPIPFLHSSLSTRHSTRSWNRCPQRLCQRLVSASVPFSSSSWHSRSCSCCPQRATSHRLTVSSLSVSHIASCLSPPFPYLGRRSRLAAAILVTSGFLFLPQLKAAWMYLQYTPPKI